MRTNAARRGIRVAMLALVLATAGCATNRSEVRLAPGVAPSAANLSAKPVAIRTLTDERTFEERPRDPSIPSLGFEGSAMASADIKARAVGRKRNTYGMALGDVLLEQGDTVERRVRAELTNGLHDAGYRVVAAGPESAGVPQLDVRIRRFWSWITPGLFTVALSTIIGTEIAVSGASAPMLIEVRASEPVLVGSDGVWIEAIEKALQRYRAEIASRMTQLP